MAKDIQWMGAIFPDVPSITLPQQGGGLASFDDTSDGDIQPADVAQGKIGYAQGQRVVGTAVPSTPTIQSLSVTENGTYTAPSGVDGYSPVTVSVSGGASNVVSGEFTTPSTNGTVTDIDIPYSGNGYPIAAMVYIKGGTLVENSAWYSLVHRYAVGAWMIAKSDVSQKPDYTDTSKKNRCTGWTMYKNNESDPQIYSRGFAADSADIYNKLDASQSGIKVIKFKNDTVLSTVTYDSSYGLVPSTTYTYHIIYST